MFAFLIALASAASTHAPKQARKWTVIEQSAPTEGSKILIAMVKADAAAAKTPNGGTPILGLTCDGQGFYVAVRWQNNLVQGFTKSHQVPMTLKLDDKPIQHEVWGARESSAFKAGREGLDWFHSLVGSKRLTVSVAEKSGREQATFDLAGVAALDTKLQALSCIGPDQRK